MKENDCLFVLEADDDPGWWRAETRGAEKSGFVPSNYVDRLSSRTRPMSFLFRQSANSPQVTGLSITDRRIDPGTRSQIYVIQVKQPSGATKTTEKKWEDFISFDTEVQKFFPKEGQLYGQILMQDFMDAAHQQSDAEKYLQFVLTNESMAALLTSWLFPGQTVEVDGTEKESHEEVLMTVKAIAEWAPQSDEELHLRAGDIVQVLEANTDGWWFGELESGMKGLFPKTYVKVMEEPPLAAPPPPPTRSTSVTPPPKTGDPTPKFAEAEVPFDRKNIKSIASTHANKIRLQRTTRKEHTLKDCDAFMEFLAAKVSAMSPE
jgi:hypothetical protein